MEVGTVIAGKLRVERVLGRGGMGVVVVARHLQLNQLVAVKVLRPEVVSPEMTARFLREGQASAQLRSEHVCKVFDVGTLEDGAPYLVMELLEGHDLAAAIAQQPLSVAAAIDVIVQASEAIAEAHALGIVHRDLKPANLFLGHRFDGTSLVKVLDFGIATAPAGDDIQLTQTSSMMGTPAFMSPEQLRSARSVDPRSDIWALGVILYQAVTRRLPFPGTTFGEVTARVLTEPPQPLGADPHFDAIVMRCLAKDPAQRYPTVGQLAADLRSVRTTGIGPVQSATLSTMPPGSTTPPYQPPTTATPSRMPVLAIGAVAIAAVIAIAVVATHSPPPSALPSPTAVGIATDRERDFVQANFSRRCDDAKRLAAALGTAEQNQAAACVPTGNHTYPHTAPGFGSAAADRDYSQAFAIGEELVKQQPEYGSAFAPAMIIAACSLHDSAGAHRYIHFVTDLAARNQLVAACSNLGVTL